MDHVDAAGPPIEHPFVDDHDPQADDMATSNSESTSTTDTEALHGTSDSESIGDTDSSSSGSMNDASANDVEFLDDEAADASNEVDELDANPSRPVGPMPANRAADGLPGEVDELDSSPYVGSPAGPAQVPTANVPHETATLTQIPGLALLTDYSREDRRFTKLYNLVSGFDAMRPIWPYPFPPFTNLDLSPDIFAGLAPTPTVLAGRDTTAIADALAARDRLKDLAVDRVVVAHHALRHLLTDLLTGAIDASTLRNFVETSHGRGRSFPPEEYPFAFHVPSSPSPHHFTDQALEPENEGVRGIPTMASARQWPPHEASSGAQVGGSPEQYTAAHTGLESEPPLDSQHHEHGWGEMNNWLAKLPDDSTVSREFSASPHWVPALREAFFSGRQMDFAGLVRDLEAGVTGIVHPRTSRADLHRIWYVRWPDRPLPVLSPRRVPNPRAQFSEAEAARWEAFILSRRSSPSPTRPADVAPAPIPDAYTYDKRHSPPRLPPLPFADNPSPLWGRHTGHDPDSPIPLWAQTHPEADPSPRGGSAEVFRPASPVLSDHFPTAHGWLDGPADAASHLSQARNFLHRLPPAEMHSPSPAWSRTSSPTPTTWSTPGPYPGALRYPERPKAQESPTWQPPNRHIHNRVDSPTNVAFSAESGGGSPGSSPAPRLPRYFEKQEIQSPEPEEHGALAVIPPTALLAAPQPPGVSMTLPPPGPAVVLRNVPITAHNIVYGAPVREETPAEFRARFQEDQRRCDAFEARMRLLAGEKRKRELYARRQAERAALGLGQHPSRGLHGPRDLTMTSPASHKAAVPRPTVAPSTAEVVSLLPGGEWEAVQPPAGTSGFGGIRRVQRPQPPPGHRPIRLMASTQPATSHAARAGGAETAAGTEQAASGPPALGPHLRAAGGSMAPPSTVPARLDGPSRPPAAPISADHSRSTPPPPAQWRGRRFWDARAPANRSPVRLDTPPPPPATRGWMAGGPGGAQARWVNIRAVGEAAPVAEANTERGTRPPTQVATDPPTGPSAGQKRSASPHVRERAVKRPSHTSVLTPRAEPAAHIVPRRPPPRLSGLGNPPAPARVQPDERQPLSPSQRVPSRPSGSRVPSGSRAPSGVRVPGTGTADKGKGKASAAETEDLKAVTQTPAIIVPALTRAAATGAQEAAASVPPRTRRSTAPPAPSTGMAGMRRRTTRAEPPAPISVAGSSLDPSTMFPPSAGGMSGPPSTIIDIGHSVDVDAPRERLPFSPCRPRGSVSVPIVQAALPRGSPAKRRASSRIQEREAKRQRSEEPRAFGLPAQPEGGPSGTQQSQRQAGGPSRVRRLSATVKEKIVAFAKGKGDGKGDKKRK